MTATTALQRWRVPVALVAVLVLLLGLMAKCDEPRDKGDHNPHLWVMAPAAAHTDAQPVIDLEGDSITDGGVLPCVCDRLAAQLSEILRVDPARVVDSGVGGSMLDALVQRVTAKLSAGTVPAGSVFVINIGMNSLFTYPGDAIFLGMYHDLVVMLLNAGMRVLVATITPVSSTHWNVELLRQRINGWLTSVFADRVLDYSTALHDRQSGTSWADGTMIMPDGIHPDEGGTRRMAQTAATTLRLPAWAIG